MMSKSAIPDHDDPRFSAGIALLRRTGAKQVQVRYSDDEDPVIWMIVVAYVMRDGRPVGSGKVNTWETAAALSPLRAMFRLLDQLIDGGTCTHCGRPTGFMENAGSTGDTDTVICWVMWDPEAKAFTRGCEATHA
jgi:hypothetical protein